jgi:hypothetical protein
LQIAGEGVTIFWKILPTDTWQTAGANVRFSQQSPDWPAYFDEFQAALAKLGRSSIFYGQSGFQPLLSFNGDQWNGQFDGATSVMHDVCSILKSELTNLFSVLPIRDH